MSDPAGTLAGDWPDARVAYDVLADEYAHAYAGELAGKSFDRTVLDDLAERTGRGGLAADLGCGPAAQVGVYLRNRGLRVVGLDLSPRCAARSPLPSAAADLVVLPVRAASLDAVVCFYALIHLPRSAVPQALSAILLAMRPGGRVVLAVHAGTGEMSRRGWFGHDVEVRATLFGRSELHGLLAAAGFADVRVARRAPYPQELPTPRLYATAVAP